MRNNGLDLIRSIAIILVLVCHLTIFFSQDFDTLGLMYVTGYLGVEFFFVLSGFLIGKVIIVEVYEKKSLYGLKKFYFRRWYRTLPLYFLIVFALALIKGLFTWENLFFIQNFSTVALKFNPVSWSLSVEEWFYLVAPLIFLVIVKFSKKSRFLFLITCIIFILLELVFRVLWNYIVDTTWDFGVRKQIFLRLDSIMVGVLLAGIKYYYHNIYNKICCSKALLLISFLVFIYFGVFNLHTLIVGHYVDQSFFSKTILFTIISLCIAVFIANIESNRAINIFLSESIFGNIVRFISVTSYAVYLIHYEIFVSINSYISGYNIPLYNKFIIIFSVTVFVYTIAYVLHKHFEKPIMNYRDIKYPNNRK